MPTYDYVCTACGHNLEIFQSMTESPKRKCPACGKQKLERQIGAGAGILFKGSGFYQTDYRSDSYQKGAKAESSASAANPASGSEGAGQSSASESPKAPVKDSSRDSGRDSGKDSTKGSGKKKLD